MPVQAAVILLLPHELNIRSQHCKALPQKLLHRQIHIGDIVCFALGPDAVDCGGVSQAGSRLPHRLNDLFRRHSGPAVHTAALWVRMET